MHLECSCLIRLKITFRLDKASQLSRPCHSSRVLFVLVALCVTNRQKAKDCSHYTFHIAFESQTPSQHLPRPSPMHPSHLTPSPPPSTSGHFLLPESLMKNLPSLPSLTPLFFKPSSLSSDLHSISHSQLPSIPSLLPPHTTTSIQPKIPIPIHSSHATAASNPAPSTMVEQTSSATIPLEWTLHNHMATTFTSISSHPYHQQLSNK